MYLSTLCIKLPNGYKYARKILYNLNYTKEPNNSEQSALKFQFTVIYKFYSIQI
jgi:hypothetical protein